jgi:DNA polymerase-1
MVTFFAFRSAASAENDDLGRAIWRMEEMIDNTLAETGADEFSIFLSGEKNFRYDIYPEYKANRTAPKPRHLKDLKNYLVEKYNAQVADCCEADDLLGIAQCQAEKLRKGPLPIGVEWPPDETIICSIDKDLRMIPGNHYSFEISGINNGTRWVRPSEILRVEEFAGLTHFYTQILVGDTADNVKGAAGIGKVKAGRILLDATNERELFEATRACFSSDEEFIMNAKVLWIWRKENDIWQPPKFGD